MTQVTLPAVAKSFYTFCKKCDADRYHIVLTHKSSTSAKVQCEVCKGIKTYSLPKAGSTVAKKSSSSTGSKVVRAKKSSHSDDFQALTTNRSAEKAIPFSIKTKFEMNQKIEHSTFGMGYVKAVQPDRIEVMFESEVKTLMHNKV